MSWKPEVDEINQRRALALGQGGPEAVAKQHSQNRLTIRERVDQLLDSDSFEELGRSQALPSITRWANLLATIRLILFWVSAR